MIIDDIFEFRENKINIIANNLTNQTILRLSKQLVKDMNTKLVRVDWMIYQNKPYFEEFTFTPYSGFHAFKSSKNSLKLGNLIKL